jgi:hypothetical protein
LKEVFNKFDVNKSGTVTQCNFLAALYKDDERQGNYYKQMNKIDTLLREIRHITNQ